MVCFRLERVHPVSHQHILPLLLLLLLLVLLPATLVDGQQTVTVEEEEETTTLLPEQQELAFAFMHSKEFRVRGQVGGPLDFVIHTPHPSEHLTATLTH